MKAVLQRVLSATVFVDSAVTGTVSSGLLVLLGVGVNDTAQQAIALAKKSAELRIFEDENEKMNLSAIDQKYGALVVSNFTLYADCNGGRRPYFVEAARPEKAQALYDLYVSELKKYLSHVQTGVFGADMKIETLCDGPVTIILEI